MVVFAIVAVVVVGAVLYFAGRKTKAAASVTQDAAKVENKLSELKSEIESAVKGAEKP